MMWSLQTAMRLPFCLLLVAGEVCVMSIRVDTDLIKTTSVLAAFEEAAGDVGAIASFVGKVRGNAQGAKVDALILEHYPELTEASIHDIVGEAEARWQLSKVLVVHRVGRILPTETIVLVCAASCHRRDAFLAVDFIMDYLKTKALFWKKEQRENENIWIEPRKADYADAARWAKSKKKG